MFEALAEFRKAHGHCNVPKRWSENPKLANWVYTQRQYRKKGKLNRSRTKRLDKIGFQWNIERSPTWDERFSELVEFKKIYGHCEVPTGWPENTKLAQWVLNQRRRRYKDDATGKERIRRLEKIGFRWRIRKRANKGE